jgi:hypothetical protein
MRLGLIRVYVEGEKELILMRGLLPKPLNQPTPE